MNACTVLEFIIFLTPGCLVGCFTLSSAVVKITCLNSNLTFRVVSQCIIAHTIITSVFYFNQLLVIFIMYRRR